MEPSDLSLTFDVETHVDAAQQIRVGGYELRKGSNLREAGLFYDPASLNRSELRTLQRYAAKHGLELMTVQEFVDRIFYGIAYLLNATIIGMNIGFDISRLAIDHDSARGRMRGGFTFKLSQDPRWPNVQIKHLSNRASLIRFAAPRRQRTSRSGRDQGRRVPVRRGFFADVKTSAGALLSGSHSLFSLSHALDTPLKKVESDEHGEELTEGYLDYLRRDVTVTWQCFERLRDLYASYRLNRTLFTKLYSEASLGKALLRQMGIQGWRTLQPSFPRRSIGRIMATYFGGRSEVRQRREVVQVQYVDFLSMYPTVCALMGLWRFVIAKGIRSEDATTSVRRLLRDITLEDLRNTELWETALTTIVQVRPTKAPFPVRSRYDGAQYTIGLNYLTSERPMWLTLSDCIVSTLIGGQALEVLKALRYEPVGIQDDLSSIDLFGNPEYRIDPVREDPFRRIIELRSTVKVRRDAARTVGDEAEADRLDGEQLALKILANATSYGIFVEMNVRNFAELQDLTCYGIDDPFPAASRNLEEPGNYFHPLLATLITGAARLMLACAEVLTEREGLGWMLCDTDSWALTRPAAMSQEEFLRRAARIREWFQGLSPYRTGDRVLKLEEANFRVVDGKVSKELEPLYGFAVSDKRYALFNLDGEGRPLIRKASAHGLGHLLAPYGEKQAPTDIPAPIAKLSEIGVARWQHDLWFRIVQAALAGHPERIDLDLPGFDAPAAARYAATTPVLLRWFDRYNRMRSYRERVRPFGFMLAFQAHRKHSPQATDDRPKERHKAPTEEDYPKAVAPFDKDLRVVTDSCFDRETGSSVPRGSLPTYRDVLAQYHLHPEDKFLNGDYTDSGLTVRRHVQVSGVEHIGKEADRWEEQFFVGLDPEAQITYGDRPDVIELALASLIRAGERFGRRRLAAESGVSLGEVSMVLRGVRKPGARTVSRLLQGVERLSDKQLPRWRLEKSVDDSETTS